MKKHFLLLAAILVWCAGAVAQNTVGDSLVAPKAPTAAAADTTDEDDEENVIGGRVAKSRYSGEANVLGAPIYYDSLGNVIGGNPEVQHRGVHNLPSRHYLNSLENNYCSFFLEAQFLIAPRDVAAGVNFAYLPERWGAYATLMAGINHTYLSVGPSVRLLDASSSVDWQLYGGLMLGGQHAGAELGTRVALPRRESSFCWTSASMGLGVINGDTYFTMGISFSLVALSALSILLF